MATISKFYLHDATTTNTGTMPGAGDVFFNNGDITGDATGARTARLTNDTIGVLETSSVVTATANTNAQTWGHRRFVSPPLAARTFAAADGTWTLSWANVESNTNHNGSQTGNIRIWRPSTGAVVGTAHVLLSGSVISSTTKASNSGTGSWSGTQAILNGDILVFEISTNFTQSMGTAYTENFYYDGTTEAGTTSKASFITPPSALTLATSGTTYIKAGYGVESA